LNGKDLVDNERISGVTSSQLVIAAVNYADAGDYSLVASNAAGCVTGRVARLAVTPVLAWGDNTLGQTQVPPSASNVVMIAAGENHSLALLADGRALGWGDNAFGQAQVPGFATNLVSLAAGQAHSLALSATGDVLAWGDDSYGQSTVPSSLPVAVVVAAGARHSLALLADGAVVAWGDNTFGQTAVPEDATNVVAIAAGDFFSLALCADGRLATWGDVSPHDDLVAIAAGAGHRLALRSTGELVAWGRNAHGQATVPEAVSNPAAISAGGDHSLALSADGQILAWGGNYSHQAEPPWTSPGIAAIGAGGAHSLALVGDGAPVISGLPGTLTVSVGRPLVLHGQITGALPQSCQWFHNGTALAGATRPYLVLTNIQRPNAGVYVLVVTNREGATASSPITLHVQPEPFIATPFQEQTVFLGRPICFSATVWGEAPFTYQWQLNTTNLANDNRISGADTASLCIAVAHFDDIGEFTLTANNAYGTANQAIARLSVTPVCVWGISSQAQVPAGTSNAVAIAAGRDHSLALRADGTVVAWGRNTSEQTNVPGFLTNVVAIAGGENHSLALVETGRRTPLRFDPAALRIETDGSLHVRLLGASGRGPVIVLASPDLTAWTPIFTNAPVTGSVDFVDAGAVHRPQTFYRAYEYIAPPP
jgi:alpha-tubulin suppressor-like RCC1 family protein